MTIKVLFSWQYDLDFCALYADETFDLAGAIKGALRAWAYRDVTYRIPVPASTGLDLAGKPLRLGPCRVTLTLSDTEDALLIEMLGRIRTGHRNGFIKNCTRRYFSSLVESPYLSSSMFDVPSRFRDRLSAEPSNKGKILHPQLNTYYDPSDPEDLARIRDMLAEKDARDQAGAAKEEPVRKALDPAPKKNRPVQKEKVYAAASSRDPVPEPEPVPEPANPGFDLFDSMDKLLGF